MDENSLTETILRTAGLIVIISVVILLGWNEPLKYRFMSREEIYALENPQKDSQQGTTPATGAWMWEKRNHPLEKGAYNRTTTNRAATPHNVGGR